MVGAGGWFAGGLHRNSMSFGQGRFPIPITIGTQQLTNDRQY